jgi:hypothetical protein
MSEAEHNFRRGWHDHTGKLVLEMPDNQNMESYHYGLHELIHDHSNLEWKEEEDVEEDVA